jgi:arylsulfatase A-like enzyme
MADDHAYQAISAYGSKLVKTPNIDRLANEGVLFNKAFVTNSICSPSRAVCLTGKYSHINGVRDNVDNFDSAQQTFPKLLQKAGYQTAIIGKWHLKSQPSGFDYWQVLPDQGDYYQPEFITPEGKITEQGYATDIITDKTIDWIKTKRDTTRPFMIMCHHKAPHREWMPAQRYLNDLVKDYPEPASLFDDYKNRGTAARDAEMRISNNMGLTNDNKIPPEVVEKLGFKEFLDWYKMAYEKNLKRLTTEELRKWEATYKPIVDKFVANTPQGDELTRWKYQRYMQDYIACVEAIDDNIGRLLDYLDKSDLSKNTLIVYTSDQGFYLGEHGWFDKRFMYEESFRTPLIMSYPPLIKAGTQSNDLVLNLDFAETFLELAGVDVPEEMQGMSLLPALKENNYKWRDAIYYHYYEYPGIHAVKRHYGIRTNRYKLIHFYYDIDEWELYDLEKDPYEMNNIYNKPQYDVVQKQLHEQLDLLRKKYKDSDELDQKFIKSDLERIHG